MDYRFSHLIGPSSYDNQGLSNGIPLRCHRNSDVEEAGTLRLRRDWIKNLGSLPSSSKGGNLGPIYPFISVVIPECLPDRLEIASYLNKFGFLHDDLIDTATMEKVVDLNKGIMESVEEWLGNAKFVDEGPGEGRILQGIVAEMVAIDAPRAVDFMNWYKMDLDVPRDRTTFADFGDYLDFRVVDMGALVLTGLMTFGLALTIPPQEKDTCWRLTRPVWVAMGLTNDVQPWAKEVKAFQATDKTCMPNGVWIIMKRDSVDVGEAKLRVLQVVKSAVAEYTELIRNIHKRVDLSQDSRLLLEAAQYMISGNVAWGTTCPRYHAEQSLTKYQLARMENGWPDPMALFASSLGSKTPHTNSPASAVDGTAQDTNDVKGAHNGANELQNMYMGQSHDIYWSSGMAQPSTEEYLKMVDYSKYATLSTTPRTQMKPETGGLFRILASLMSSKLSDPKFAAPGPMMDISTLLGRYFQVRDDYMNLSSSATAKGSRPEVDSEARESAVHARRVEGDAGPY
ncbi:hypothetical protein PG997_001918 [Apiospora hydei]|uniref:Uncharacterized protein n=1 Tax=Apiospora hydei TaxID=1337664 RepID=A0ABR1X7X9_9PEZI